MDNFHVAGHTARTEGEVATRIAAKESTPLIRRSPFVRPIPGGLAALFAG